MAEDGREGEEEPEWREGVEPEACDELDARFRETEEVDRDVRVPGLAASWDICRPLMLR
jgi:hypothetical protein